ncbi:MAG: ABC transporter ATP-binding protein/permease [Ruminococcus sp.]|nr:ABC transporter ATP-binding protein/permease [Ruminococcus sp.]
MLRIQNVSKQYKTGDLIQRALDDVSLSLRDNEFVAILGPSGSGKTTLLNIIGGLDRYDTGDLIINGISTQRYSDRDWDSYRNHTIGFVFQSYNLIPHQTILSNVELALTISGVSASLRKKKAKEALEKVGLGDQIHKKPSQLSGGQMQRVAIARALVNDPDILLADEPTGALDSETSIHVMDLLKEVAQDRLVVMVTHNPELARDYSTRIVELKDGRIISDSDPFETDETAETVHKNMGRSSMSPLTSLLLSFNNLWTKKARTILVSIAGSIGIIGIAMILSMSTGADKYIKNIEEESLQSYPLQINATSLDFTSMYLSSMGSAMDSLSNDAEVTELKTVTGFLSNVQTNDLKSLKAYFESDECDIYDYVQALEYSYSIIPQIYSVNDDGSYRKINPNTSFSSMGFGSSETISNSLLSSYSSTDVFYVMPENKELYTSAYEVKAGRWPEKYNECVMVITANGSASDITLYSLGLKDPKQLDDMVKNFNEGKSTEVDDTVETFEYDDFIGLTYKLVPSFAYYTYDKEYKVWIDRSSEEKYMKDLLSKAEDISIVGVVTPFENSSAPILQYGVNYPAELMNHLIDEASRSDIVKAQLNNTEIDVLSGKKFSEVSEEKDFDMASMFNINTDSLSDLFNFSDSGFDMSGLDLSGLDLSGMDFSDMDPGDTISLDQLASMMPEMSEKDLEKIFSSIKLNVSKEEMEQLFQTLLDGFSAYAKQNPSSDFSKFPEAISQYLASDEARQIISDELKVIINEIGQEVMNEEYLTQIVEDVMSGYAEYLESIGAEGPSAEYLADYLNTPAASEKISDNVAEIRDKILSIAISPEKISEISTKILEGYNDFADEYSYPTVESIMTAFTDYLATEEAQKTIGNAVSQIVDTKQLENLFSEYMSGLGSGFSTMISSVMTSVTDGITQALTQSMGSLTGALSNSLSNAFSFNKDSFSDLFSANMDMSEMSNLMLSLLSKEEKTYENNLKKLGYADLDNPSAITIYPTDFDSKQVIKQIIEDYNKRMEDAGEDDKTISYTDMVDTLMGSVTDIVNAISYVLIAFVAISLVVSSIMIGVITYISVLERKKEIGILRALGASKGNISQVFNAETFIIGALAGLIGVGITYLLLIPGNAILHALLPEQNIYAYLPPGSSFILVILSIILTLIGGLIPSRKAAKKDPVIALRTE